MAKMPVIADTRNSMRRQSANGLHGVVRTMFAIFLSVPIGNEAISTMADSAMVDDLFGYIDVFARERPLGANRFSIDFEFSR